MSTGGAKLHLQRHFKWRSALSWSVPGLTLPSPATIAATTSQRLLASSLLMFQSVDLDFASEAIEPSHWEFCFRALSQSAQAVSHAGPRTWNRAAFSALHSPPRSRSSCRPISWHRSQQPWTLAAPPATPLSASTEVQLICLGRRLELSGLRCLRAAPISAHSYLASLGSCGLLVLPVVL